MQTREAKLKKGDWIAIPGTFGSRFIGYILKASNGLQQYEVQVLRKSNGVKYERKVWIDFNDVFPYGEELEEEDFYQMMEIAIDTNDKDWFNELHERIPKEMPF
ncbi:hypothetical protein [Heyndrickxia oleronia]|uniref:hypothetical protein n=1 Tax=Heyndrickxia oleronia TaxID=38875 RepID=UPI001B0F14AE|nr:hypothetical protein [Heyndrickxia oleronia]GIN38481.1 hypothetical protein J19TS1_14300 [Heyndrickxia oleronia]